MIFADEAYHLSLALLTSMVAFVAFAYIVLLCRGWMPRLDRRLSPGQRPLLLLLIFAGVCAYLLSTPDLPSRPWGLPMAGLAAALLILRRAPTLQPQVLRVGWVLLTWQSVVGAKLTYLPESTTEALVEASLLLMLNLGEATLHPLASLATHASFPGALDSLAATLTSFCQASAAGLVPFFSFMCLIVVYFIQRLASERPDAQPIQERPPTTMAVVTASSLLLAGGVAAGIIALTFRQGSPWFQGLLLLALMLLPQPLPVLVAAWRKAPLTPRLAWRIVSLSQALLGAALLWFTDGDAQWALLGMLLLGSSFAIPLWFGAALLLVGRHGRLRVLASLICAAALVLFPLVGMLILVLGWGDIIFDIAGLRRRPGAGRPAGPVWRWRHLLRASLLALPALIWYGVTAAIAYADIPHLDAAQLPRPAAIVHPIGQDPWEITRRTCASRGQRPCRAAQLICGDRSCELPLVAPPGATGGTLICYPDRSLGRLFSETNGWFPTWRDVYLKGYGPQQFSAPPGRWPRALFKRHSLFVFCCPTGKGGAG